MRWFRRRPAEPPRPARPATPEPKAAVVDVEPAAEVTATIPTSPEPADVSPAAASAPDREPPAHDPNTVTGGEPPVAEPEPVYVPPLRHWHRAEIRAGTLRGAGSTRVAPARVDSGRWHRV